MTTQNYICPNCGGKGCAVCQNTGQVSLSDQEIQELQKLTVKPSFQTQTDSVLNFPVDQTVHQEKKLRGQLAGILTIVFLVLVSASAFTSWFFAHTLKPFLQFWSVFFTLIIIKLVMRLKFFKEEPVNDFLGKIEEEGVKVKKSPFYPLF